MSRWYPARAVLGAIAVAGLALAPLAGAETPPEQEPREVFHAKGELSRFRDLTGRECIPDHGEGEIQLRVAVMDDSRVVARVQGWAECRAPDYTYWRGFGYQFDMTGSPETGYRFEDPEWCVFLEVGPIPQSPDTPWSVVTGEPNLVLGGCEVFGATVHRTPEREPAPWPLPVDPRELPPVGLT